MRAMRRDGQSMNDQFQHDDIDTHESTPCTTCRTYGRWYEDAEGRFLGWDEEDCDGVDGWFLVTCDECDGTGISV
jgi:hypothetical protein